MVAGLRSESMVQESISIYKVLLQLERRPLYFLVNTVVPIIFMGILNILVFLQPAESGERISYAVTVLLATAVFLTLIGDNMPKSSKPMSIVCYFLLSELSLSAFICITAILNLRLFFKPRRKPNNLQAA